MISDTGAEPAETQRIAPSAFSLKTPGDIPEISPLRERARLVRGPVRPFPVIHGGGPPTNYDGERGGERGPWGTYTVPSAICLYPSMVLATQRHEIIAPTLTNLRALRVTPGFRRARREDGLDRLKAGGTIAGRIQPTEHLEGSFFLLGSAPRSYYHWLIEYLPNVAVWREQPGRTKILIPELRHRWQRESLLHAGVVPADVVEIKGHTLVVGELTFADRINPTENKISRSIVPFFRDLQGSTGLATPTRRLFVSRALADRRRLVNEDEVLARLRPLGFEKVTAEDLSFADQASLFGSAEIIAGPHGAGLANAVFAASGAIVIEVRPGALRPDGVSAFATLAGLFQQRYGLVFGESVSADQRAPRSADFSVSPDAVHRLVDAFLSAQAPGLRAETGKASRST